MLEHQRAAQHFPALPHHVPSSAHPPCPAFTFDDAIKKASMVDKSVDTLLAQMTIDECLALLDGDVPFWPGLRSILNDRYNRHPFVHGAIPRLRIPGIKFTDGPRGIVMGSSTAFPVSMSRGASWDVDLETRIGRAIGLEGRAQGANYYAGICINLPRHPAWGRAQETYGEDPILLGSMGSGLAQGVGENLMTCVKHFALNSMENARFRVDVQVDDAALHEVYLPHFRRLVQEARVDSVMSSYNSVRGEWVGQSRELLTEVLREQWGFDGFVLSDFIFGLRDPALSVISGLDIEAPFSQQRAQHLRRAYDDGQLKWPHVEAACSRILRKQILYAARTDSKPRPDQSVVFCEPHRKLAREAAAKGMVLLKNQPVAQKKLLPIANDVKRIAIVGRLARSENTGDRGSSHVHSPRVVSPVEGLRAAFPKANIIIDDSDSAARAAETARLADVVLCFVGYSHSDEGEYVVPSFKSDPQLLDLLPPCQSDEDKETYDYVTGAAQETGLAQDGIVPGAGGDRKSLRLREQDRAIITAVSAVNSNLIVSVVAAGAIIMEEWIDKVPALLLSWYSGCEGGHALAEVITGKEDASGRLPFSIPRDESHLPFYDMDAKTITYDKWFGQRLLDKLGVQARFPLGYGESYTRFEISGPYMMGNDKIPLGAHNFSVGVNVSNIGARAGRFVAQVYGRLNLPDFPSCVLLGFAVVELQSQEERHISIPASIRPLLRWTAAGWIRPGKWIDVEVAAYHGDPDAKATKILVCHS